MSSDLPPPTLRNIAHYVKIANEYASRDVVIYYWCLYRAVNDGMQMDKSSPDALNYLKLLMSTLEKIKQQNTGNEALTSDVVAQAHIENQAQRMFNYAESQDRQGIFNTKVVKAFYTSSYLFDVLSVFGELDENILSARKYARWRATYVHNSLKKGEQPIPGHQMNAMYGFPEPPGGSDTNFSPSAQPPPSRPPPPPTGSWNADGNASMYPSSGGGYSPSPAPRTPASSASFGSSTGLPQQHGHAAGPSLPTAQPAQNLTLDNFMEAKKFLKYAMSSLDYDDANAAIENMHKALSILQKK
ncbi:vta1 like domain-containing protein [Ditylenchus destructor]|uniref:Vta1 like domain-containing protein n=1 Tax=Ditylenchus destructor TaxID=166010 RepID=A0AAD4NL30_9BILA|nr:vta1 like domain-containing protein [Ditylenchus destructor]